MRKRIIFVLIIVALFLITACGNSGDRVKSRSGKTNTVDDVLLKMMEEENRKKNNNNEEIYYDKETGTVPTGKQSGLNHNAPLPEDAELPAEAVNTEEGYDIDLTRMSATLVYSTVYDMMVYPEKYVGKKVKMTGISSSLHDEDRDIYYYACIIMDATACCSQGIEFVLTEDYACPGDYPSDGETCTVGGTFDTYWEGNYIYCTLRNAKLM
ncbi:MAG: hypothetical protein K6G60_04720 [Lachnospiraceae bacterium]|nr:hypothetical protein [Lachnospiraceae bacterium]